ncbi:MAG: DNA-directed RNA polymerase subunit beta' [bacterium]|jgi:DNA-directed RNA polymerase subunit beta'|nr:DNA-directed RNA polymerase subunit beta' [bacterium]
MWKSLQTPAAKRREDEVRDINKVRAIKISLTSPDQVRSWSYGEVKNPETIDYKTYKPKNDGLFCERIFGPTRDYECACGKFKGIKHRGVVCDRCGVELTQSKVRRSRLGHIELEMPVAHIWFSKGVPSLMALLLDMSIKSLERVLYYEEYIVLDPGSTGLNDLDVISERECARLREEYGNDFRVGMGAEAVKEILMNLDLEVLAEEMRVTIREGKSKQRVKRCIKRLKVIEDFRSSDNRPEWMIMDVLPVIPPDLRPLVPLDGGRFATSDLNDLYRRVINRNNRLRRLKEVRAPEVIIRNEKRMLQEAVDALLDNGRRGRPVKGSNNRPLKSLSDMLKGKQGRFRQNLLGKRVDYSGRSVIVCGPDLRYNECGLPKQMALELFEPFIIRRLEELDEVTTIRSAKRKIERGDPEVYDVLEEVIQNHPVLLNRAPTLHRMGIQGFQPRLVEGKAIRLHPLTCAAFNADFDGDQMAVHLPLSQEAQDECRDLMLAQHNIISPANGKPIATPSQDIVLGCYFLTKIRIPIDTNTPKRFTDETEAIIALDHEAIGLQEEVEVRISGTRMRTTAGRILFNDIIPDSMRFKNKTMDKKTLSKLVLDCYKLYGKERTARFLDDLKDIGYRYAKLGGISIGLDDMVVPQKKATLLEDARRDVQVVMDQFEKGAITDVERYNKVIDRWIHTTEAVAQAMMDELEKSNQGFNPIYIMADSGARGSKQQIRQLAGMRGLMSKPMKKLTGGIGEIIESPIESNFKEGLTVLEYFISTHGARKGLADTALKTAEAGYLTRRLVDVAQDMIITQQDCGTLAGLYVEAIKEGDHVIENVEDRILGRVAAEDIYNPLTGSLIVAQGEVINEDSAHMIGKCGIERVFIRSVVACESPRGVCAKCYGWDLARRDLARNGEAVGIVAAQSIGEPGTQLTLRTFHIGGTTSRILEESEIRVRKNTASHNGLRDGESGIVKYINLRAVSNRNNELVTINTVGRPLMMRSGIACPDLGSKTNPILRYENLDVLDLGDKKVVLRGGGSLMLTNSRGKEIARFPSIPVGAQIFKNDNDKCETMEPIATWDPTIVPLISKVEGKVNFENFKDKDLVKDKDVFCIPYHIINAEISVTKGKTVETITLQPGHCLMIKNGDSVKPGDVLAFHRTPTVAHGEGKVRYKDILEGITVRRVLDPGTNNLKSVITDYAGDKIPRIRIVDRNEEIIEEYTLPAGSILTIEDGADVLNGFIMAHTEQVVDQFRQLDPGLPLGAIIYIRDGEEIRYNGNSAYRTSGNNEAANIIARWDPYFKAEIAAKDGKCRFDQIIEGVTMRRQRGEHGGGAAQMIIMEHREDKHPSINIVKRGTDPEYHPLPSGSHIVVNDGDDIMAGDILAKIPRESFKSRDVTGGLPRVEELFEARRPKARDLAIITKVDGWVRLPKPEEIDEEMERKLEKKRKRGTRIILICDKDGEVLSAHEVDVGKHVIVSDGDWVSTGDKLVDGSIDPHEYLEVMGERATQKYLLNEIQEVYRLQGVGINDKHIETIVRQMMRKVTITDPGDTMFLQDDDIDRFVVQRENDQVMRKGGKPAQFKPKLLGITKASLGTESFISAASFQETTRVLTQAAISGKIDHLLGLKENVIMGHLIPAGSGWRFHQDYYDKIIEQEMDKATV